ncbi:MAG: hypothetical protein P8Y44_12805 [Acidobacteriota bacterium]
MNRTEMEHAVLVTPWPQRRAEMRLVEWADYERDPTVGLAVDPETGEPYGDVIRVEVELLDYIETPPGGVRLSDERVELTLRDYLTYESRRRDLSLDPWARSVRFEVLRVPPAVTVDPEGSTATGSYSRVRDFIFEQLSEGPVLRSEIVSKAAEVGISESSLETARARLRLAQFREEGSEDSEILWRLRMSQAYSLKRPRE